MEITGRGLETGRGPGEWFMTHLALQQHDEAGTTAAWGERVIDAEYREPPSTSH